ncbi:MAG: methylated-DNA--[protein]-cysteine S-methyltransferase [Microgenomates group bacterium]
MKAVVENGYLTSLNFEDGRIGIGKEIFDLPIRPKGTDFQKKVWKELIKVPYGETITYKELARRIGVPRAIRAVASAVAKNPILIIIPCHRVIRSDGGMGGYSAGIAIKNKLLRLESGKIAHGIEV